jgi:hypothetical protein
VDRLPVDVHHLESDEDQQDEQDPETSGSARHRPPLTGTEGVSAGPARALWVRLTIHRVIRSFSQWKLVR